MAKIYISSTYSDLKDYREGAYRALRKLGHDVIAMEDYTASDQRPLDKCLSDVDQCDVYIGIFAWRYGYVPPDQGKSITELEFRQAVNKKRCLLFLLDDNAPWPKTLMDKDAEKIETLREELKRDYLVEFFSNKDELASCVTIAVSKALATVEADKPHAAVDFQKEDRNSGLKEILGILKPIIIVLLSILFISILSMILCIVVPSVRNGVDLKLALGGLGSISTFSSGCLMFTIDKFVRASQRA